MNLYISLLVSTAFALANSQSLAASFHEISGVEGVGFDFDTIPPQGNRSVRCGNEILNETSGSIEYKVSEHLQPNERCVWLIRSPKATRYSVALSSLGFQEANRDHRLTVTSFDAFNPAVNVVLDHLGVYNLDGSNVLVVTLHTGPSANVSNSTGFSLGYKAIQEGESLITQGYTDWFHDASREENVRQYSGTSVVAYNLHFVFYTWKENTYNPRDQIKLGGTIDSGNSPDDFAEVYTYNVDNNWNKNATLMSYFGNAIQSNDLMFLVFRSQRPHVNWVKWNLMRFFCKGN